VTSLVSSIRWRSTEIHWDGHRVHLDVDDVLIGSDELSHMAVDIARQIVCGRVGSYEQLGVDLQEVALHDRAPLGIR